MTDEAIWIASSSLIAVAIAAFPVWPALIAAFWRRSVRRKGLFVLCASALTYGTVALIALLMLPLQIVRALWASGEQHGFYGVVAWGVLVVSGLIAAIVVPIVLRRVGWRRLTEENPTAESVIP